MANNQTKNNMFQLLEVTRGFQKGSVWVGLLFVCAIVGVGAIAFYKYEETKQGYTLIDPWRTFTSTSTEPITSSSPTATSSATSTVTAQAPLGDLVSSVPTTTIMVEGLSIPWDFAFPPNDGMLITERTGSLVHIQPDGTRNTIKLPHPVPKGEGGLLGIVLHPQYLTNHYLYLYMTTSESSKGTKNSVFRYTYTQGELTDEKAIITDIPGALYHDGGRMEFGPDGLLYITTGDAQTSAIAQDLGSLGGKILRLTDEGGIPESNPYGTAVYSYGHRNPQGLAWDSAGNLWSTEHGRSGVTSGYDELNLIEIGKNYGWPKIEGPKTQEGMIAPALQSGTTTTWAPASLLYYNGKLYWGGLLGQGLYEATITGTEVTDVRKLFNKEFGRIRTVRQGPDGMFYISTSNRDARGTPRKGDDKIIRINPELL